MVAQTNDRGLIERWIEPSPESDLAEAQLVYYGTPVWALIGYLPAVDNDVAQVAEDYGVPQDAVVAALAYYQVHRNVIDARIAANAA